MDKYPIGVVPKAAPPPSRIADRICFCAAPAPFRGAVRTKHQGEQRMADTIVDLRMSRRGLIKLGGAAAVATTGAAGAMWPIEAQLKELEHQGWSRHPLACCTVSYTHLRAHET